MSLSSHNCDFSYNSAKWSGGAIHTLGVGKIDLFGTFMSYNSALGGGAFYAIQAPQLNVVNSFISHNSAVYYGGAIMLLSINNITMETTHIESNLAMEGGGISVWNSTTGQCFLQIITRQSIRLVEMCFYAAKSQPQQGRIHTIHFNVCIDEIQF